MSAGEGYPTPPNKCPECPRRFWTREGRVIHLRNDHDIEVKW